MPTNKESDWEISSILFKVKCSIEYRNQACFYESGHCIPFSTWLVVSFFAVEKTKQRSDTSEDSDGSGMKKKNYSYSTYATTPRNLFTLATSFHLISFFFPFIETYAIALFLFSVPILISDCVNETKQRPSRVPTNSYEHRNSIFPSVSFPQS